jgi:hypothetical protein
MSPASTPGRACNSWDQFRRAFITIVVGGCDSAVVLRARKLLEWVLANEDNYCFKLPAGQTMTLKDVGWYHRQNMELWKQSFVEARSDLGFCSILCSMNWTSVQVVLMGSLFWSDWLHCELNFKASTTCKGDWYYRGLRLMLPWANRSEDGGRPEELDGCEFVARPRRWRPQKKFSSKETARYQGENDSRGREPIVFSSNGDTDAIYPSDGQIFFNSRINVGARMVPPISKYKMLALMLLIELCLVLYEGSFQV